jgi:hypothetical protein
LDTDEAAATPATIAVNAPITNSGTATAANLSVSAGTTSAAGILQLTDSTSSTSTTTAATPNAVKSAYDLASVGINVLKMQSGIYYRTPTASIADSSAVNNSTLYTPIYIPESATFDRIAILTRAAFSGSATVRLGIYNSTNGVPSTLILDAGTVSPTAASTAYEITISQTLAAGFYWLAFCQQGTAPTTPTYTGFGGSNQSGSPLLAMGVGAFGNNIISAYSQASVTGAFANAGTLASSSSQRYVWLRAT